MESDGDDSVLDGENFSAGAALDSWFDVGMWRIEIQPSTPRIEDEFLIVLSPSLDKPRSDSPKPLLINGVDAKGIETEQNIVVFMKNLSHGKFNITTAGNRKSSQKQRKLYVFGIPVGMQVQITSGGETQTTSVNSEGVLTALQKTDASKISLQW